MPEITKEITHEVTIDFDIDVYCECGEGLTFTVNKTMRGDLEIKISEHKCLQEEPS